MTCFVCGCAPLDGLAGCGLCGRCRALPGVVAAVRRELRRGGAAREGMDAMSVD